MRIKVYNFKKAPKWVQYLNILTIFLLGFAIGKIADFGLGSIWIQYLTLYGCLYGLIIGQLFIPKKEVSFPIGLIIHLKEQWSAT